MGPRLRGDDGYTPRSLNDANIQVSMKTLLTVTAIIEAGAGLALLAVPSVTASLLLGMPLDSRTAAVCWLARRDAQSLASRGLVVAMAFYNVAVAAVLAFASLHDGLHGVLLWPAVIFHVAMAVWCVGRISAA
jgi:hypothetical protein